jgi:hypothetical protein
MEDRNQRHALNATFTETNTSLSADLPIVPALPAVSELATYTKNQLTDLLHDLLQHVSESEDGYRWKMSLMTGTFQNSLGERIAGRELVTQLAVRTFKEQNPTSKEDAKAIGAKPGFNVSDIFDDFMKREYDLEPLKHQAFGATVPIPPTLNLDRSKLSTASTEALQAVFSLVCDSVFHGDVLAMSLDIVQSIKLSFPEKSAKGSALVSTGEDLLKALSVARFKRDKGEEFKNERSVLKAQGYKPLDTLTAVRQEILVEMKANARARFVTVPSLENALASSTSEACAAVLTAVFRGKFAGRETDITYHHLFPIHILDNEGREASASVMLARYAVSLFRSENPESDKSSDQILGTAGYKLDDVLARFKREQLGLLPTKKFPATFSRFSPQQFEEFKQQEKLTNILPPLGVHPGVLIEGLMLLSPDSFKGRDVKDFVQRYVGLEVERGEDFGAPSHEGDLSHNGYILALFAALDAHKRLDFSEAQFDRHLQLLIRTLRRQFESAPSALIDSLNEQAAAYSEGKECHYGEPARAFLHKLFTRAADHFQSVAEYPIHRCRTQPFPYQREGVRFLASRTAAILADDVGLGKTYQAGAAALAIDAKRVLWVTTAPAKEGVRADLLEHLSIPESEALVITDANPTLRSAQITNLSTERFVITNYETLVALKSRRPNEYEKLTKDIDVLVLDEAQRADNPRSLRSQAITSIDAGRRWILSATPYQNRYENLWTILNQIAPTQFPNRNGFKDTYTKTTDGLVRLHTVLSDMMLRRTKEETIALFQDPKIESFDTQLQTRSPRVPTLRHVDPTKDGYVDLVPEQEEILSWMVADFRGWAEHFNANFAQDGVEIDLNTISPLVKFHWLHVAIYQPEQAGIPVPSPVTEMARRMAEDRIATGEKVIVWAWNKSVVQDLYEALKGHGARKFDGSLNSSEKELSRHTFQESNRTKALVANYQSGGVAQTFTAAHTAIIAQLPLALPKLLQVEGRHNRVIGVNNVRHAKQFSDVAYVIPRFSQGFLAGLPAGELKDILTKGSLAEQTFDRLNGARVLYNFIMEGYGDPAELERELQNSLLEGMGLKNRTSRGDLAASLSDGKRQLLRVAEAFKPVWERLQGTQRSELLLLTIVESFRWYPKVAIELAGVFARAKKIHQMDLKLVRDIVRIENKYVRELLIRKLPAELTRAYEEGDSSLAKRCGNTVEGFVLRLAKVQQPPELASLAEALSLYRDVPPARRLRERFQIGMLAIGQSDGASSYLAQSTRLLTGRSVEEQIKLLYQMGLIARLDDTLFEELPHTVESFDSLTCRLHETMHHAIDDFAGRERGSAQSIVASDPAWDGSMESVAALLGGWLTLDSEGDDVVEDFRQQLQAILDREYVAFRRSGREQTAKGCISYLSDKRDFWEAFGTNCKLTLDLAERSPTECLDAVKAEFERLKRLADGVALRVEGPHAKAALDLLSLRERPPLYERFHALRTQRQAVGKLLGGRLLDDAETSDVTALGLSPQPATDVAMRAQIDVVKRDLEGALAWTAVEHYLDTVLNGTTDLTVQQVIGYLRRKANYYHYARQDDLAKSCNTLAERISSLSKDAGTPVQYSIEETDAPAILARMGNLEDDLINCFNPNGNPAFTRFVVTALGSKNMKFIVVRNSEGRAVANAMMKLRRDEGGNPVLYLENGLSSGSYDFRKEMLELLRAKAQEMGIRCGIQPKVMGQIFGKVRETDPEIFGTGASSDHEYVEALFHFRKAATVRHHAREYSAEVREAQPLSHGASIMGIGTSNKRLSDFIGELKEIGATRVVDVRAYPISRRFPHFSKDALKEQLALNGIHYSWLGETLGNPANQDGERTLEGFEAYMKDPRYLEGLAQLMNLVREPGAVIAVTCAENKESECHRKYIIADIREQLKRKGR